MSGDRAAGSTACNSSPAAQAALVDEAVLIAAAQRDPHDFAPLYRRYADRVYRYALERTGSAAIADDVLGDTMLAALEGLARFDATRGSFAGWLFTIAARRIADRGRRERRLWQAITRRPEPAVQPDDTLDSLVRDEAAQRVRAALRRLNDLDREIVVLRYAAELNSREIGDALGLSEGAVRMRLSRARRQLATELDTER